MELLFFFSRYLVFFWLSIKFCFIGFLIIIIYMQQGVWLVVCDGKMALGLILGIGRAYRRKRTSSLNILTSKTGPRDYYKGKNCKPTGFHTRKGGYVVVQEKLPNYVVPDLTDFKLKPYVSQCAINATTDTGAGSSKWIRYTEMYLSR